jgi:hypothetical protein
MRRSILITLIMLALPLMTHAQEFEAPRGTANLFFGAGRTIVSGESSGVLQFGAGGEGRIYKGLGAGAEIGYLSPTSSFTDGFGLLSTNGSYHFWNGSSSQKLVPFVTAGYSLAFRDGHANLGNFGGGVDYWFRDKAALRLEVRDHVWPGEATAHFLMFRVGIVGR